ncbi:MAG: hypothetical protein KatS3mg002_1660 [Candidatus Woesearchaeota archaeon]|nr:MAG: hypothetical protein KatS3mg002_1660 [Candidatus Woesearchaeota archaeon]
MIFIPKEFLNNLLSWVRIKQKLNQPIFSYFDEYTKRVIDFSKPIGRFNVNKMLNKVSEEMQLDIRLTSHIFRKSYYIWQRRVYYWKIYKGSLDTLT